MITLTFRKVSPFELELEEELFVEWVIPTMPKTMPTARARWNSLRLRKTSFMGLRILFSDSKLSRSSILSPISKVSYCFRTSKVYGCTTYRSRTRPYAPYNKPKNPIEKSTSSAVKALLFSPTLSFAIMTIRRIKAPSRTAKKERGQSEKIFFMYCESRHD